MKPSNGVSHSVPDENAKPKHVAIIMDGNGRWAKKKNLPRVEGHRAGAKTVRMVAEESRKQGLRYLTLYAFSSENWGRPKEEVSSLMKLFRRYLDSELKTLEKNDIRLRAIGDLERLPDFVLESIRFNEERTKHCSGMDLILAVSYGGRSELCHAVQSIGHKVKEGRLEPDDISEHTISEHLYAPDIPDPDLLIRTSSESRISNFLLWQLAYSEIMILPVLWPDFSKEDYRQCLSEFSSRKRRFGLTQEQAEDATVLSLQKSTEHGVKC